MYHVYGARIKAAYLERMRGKDYVPLPLTTPAEMREQGTEGRFVA